MEAFIARYKAHFSNRRILASTLVSLLLLILSLTLNYFSAVYATERISNSVTDIVLSNIPVVDVDLIFVYGPVIFWAIVMAICLYDPKKIPFTLKSVALFIAIRSLFVILTHLAPFPDRTLIDSMSMSSIWVGSIPFNIKTFLASFFTGDDLFFSGHTGLPFLFALIFWDNKISRWFCLLSSVFFGVVVLLGHLHYSIDVLAAFFITYTIYHIALKIFPQDKICFEAEGKC